MGPDDQSDPTAEQSTEKVPASDPDRPARTRLRDRRTTLGLPVAVAVATGFVVVSGLAGFALGSATGDDLTPVSDRPGHSQGFPGWDRDGEGRNGFPGGPGERR